ncbi:MAG: hypothetical protein WC476_02560 [Phycisphaerae bacterium]|jgi:hypothetical protein
MPSVIFFTDISEPEIVFLNEVYDHLAQKGITLRVVVFKDYHRCIKKLKCDYIYLKTFNLFTLSLPDRKKRDINSYNGDFLQKLVLLEKEINEKYEIDITDYECRFNNLIGFVENMAKAASAYFVASRPYTVYKVIKKVLADKNINFIPFEKWVFAGAYQFNIYGIHKPKFDNDLENGDEKSYRMLLENLLLNYKGRHNVPEKQISLPSKYVLLLLGDGCGGGFSLKNTEEYWTIGKGWGNDFEVLSKVQECVREILPDIKLLVRQHPYTKYKFEKQHVNSPNTILADHAELDSLVSNADIVITVPGSIYYYSLAKGKKVVILGNGELCGSEAVKCVDSVDELRGYISQVSENKEVLNINKEKVIEAIMPYFKNQVWVNSETFTYRVLDKYIEGKTRTKESIFIWHLEKLRILKHQVFVYIKSKLFAVCSKIKIQFKKFFGAENQTSLE